MSTPPVSVLIGNDSFGNKMQACSTRHREHFKRAQDINLIHCRHYFHRHIFKMILSSIFLLCCGLCLVQISFAEDAPDNGITVVVNHPGIENELSLLTLRAIFSKRKRSWGNGKAITVVVLPDDHILHKQFCRRILKMYPYVLRDNWDRITFSGTGTAPVVVSNEKHLKHLVASTPGAIGYIQSTEPNSKDIHILTLTESTVPAEKGATP